MDRELYREAFHLNDTELELIAGLVPPGQMLVRKAQGSKKVQLNVDSVSHWMATNNARDNLGDVKAAQVEQWFKSLSLSRGSKAKIRNIMSALYSHAQRWEWATSNPIRHVRQSAKRSRIPTVLTPDQLKDFLSRLIDPAKTAVLLGAVTGLRAGELLGLKWSDIDFEKLEIRLIRDVVIDAALAEALWSWRLHCAYNQEDDWVFASVQVREDSPTGRVHCTGST